MRQVGNNWGSELILIIFDSTIPRPIPKRDEHVDWEALLPVISPMLFAFANRMFMEARVADARRKQTFLEAFAVEARNKK